MSLISWFEGLEHEAKPLLSAAAKWAESEGLAIVREVEAELKGKLPGELVTLFNEYVAPTLGFVLPAETTLTAVGTDLLSTALARVKAAEVSGTSLRASVINAGIEQAILLAKGAIGDTATAPVPATTAAPAPAATAAAPAAAEPVHA
jgi:hypothetical protein